MIEAPKAPRGVWSGDGVSPSPAGEGSGEGTRPRSLENFGIICMQMVHFDAF